MRRSIGLVAAILLVLVASGCQVEGLAFKRDERVEIVAPGYRETVSQPVTIDWDVTDETLAAQVGDDIQFGVFVDVDPQPPGASLDYFGRDDPRCRNTPGCPDTEYLTDRGIHTTTETEITFDRLPIAPGVDLERGQRDFHEVTVVLLNEDGGRLGESAWWIIFEIDRDVD